MSRKKHISTVVLALISATVITANLSLKARVGYPSYRKQNPPFKPLTTQVYLHIAKLKTYLKLRLGRKKASDAHTY